MKQRANIRIEEDSSDSFERMEPETPGTGIRNRSESMAEFVAGLETKLRSIAADKNEDIAKSSTQHRL
ncbi:hypothetical protein N5V81_14030 [Escherichia coli]|nr:hypothetical protein [Escherichia coli]